MATPVPRSCRGIWLPRHPGQVEAGAHVAPTHPLTGCVRRLAVNLTEIDLTIENINNMTNTSDIRIVSS